LKNWTTLIAAVAAKAASFRVIVALVSSTLVTASVTGPLAYQAVEARQNPPVSQALGPAGSVEGGGPRRTSTPPVTTATAPPVTTTTPQPTTTVEDPTSSSVPGDSSINPIPTTRPTTTVPVDLTQGVSVSVDPDRSGETLLDGTRVSGQVYIFVDAAGASKVDWYLDRTTADGTPESSDSQAPLDLFQGSTNAGAPLPLDTAARLGAGSHTLLAIVTLADGSVRTLRCDFDVLV